MIKRIRIQNFRSLVDVTVDLDDLTVLIGRSGTGKSNFIRAIRFLRDCLNSRSARFEDLGGVDKVLHPKHHEEPLTFSVTMSSRILDGELEYTLSIRPTGQVCEETLTAGGTILFHQKDREWRPSLNVLPHPSPGKIVLGAVPGLQESTIAYVLLRSGTGCYDFPGNVLQGVGKGTDPADRGFADDGSNYLAVADRIVNDISKLANWRRISRAVRTINRSADGLTLDMPGVARIDAALRFDGTVFSLDVRQESEGFRRFLAHLLALYQTPPMQTLLFEHPEMGLHPGALQSLFEEFEACPRDGRGQVILTTHSPQLLDYFKPASIRVVDIIDFESRIGLLAPEQAGDLKDALLRPGDLLTVDPARLPGQLAEVPG
jgi:predicted ATPase